LHNTESNPDLWLADEAGIHRTYVGDVERGTRNIALINIGRIAAALGVPMSRLMQEAEKRTLKMKSEPAK
jgi:transcriptional regulator with XRE-family HTH domain